MICGRKTISILGLDHMSKFVISKILKLQNVECQCRYAIYLHVVILIICNYSPIRKQNIK